MMYPDNDNKEYRTKIKQWLQRNEIKGNNIDLYITAFTHSSFKGIVPEADDYQRLEFLGDSVIDLILAKELFDSGAFSEGSMTELRKQKVNNDYLAQLFDRLKMSKLIRTAIKYTPSVKDKADFIEALFGAIFIEFSFDECYKVWENIQKKHGLKKSVKKYKTLKPSDKLDKENFQKYYKELKIQPKNAKSVLQELCQKQGLEPPVYQLIGKEGPDHKPVFTVKLSGTFFKGPPMMRKSVIGKASSKKLAEIKAAEKLCDMIYLPYTPS